MKNQNSNPDRPTNARSERITKAIENARNEWHPSAMTEAAMRLNEFVDYVIKHSKHGK